MKILIDTNVILDVLFNRQEFAEDSAKVLKLCETKQTDGVICALSVPNIVYIMRRELTPQKISQVLETLGQIAQIADLKSQDLTAAAQLCFKDFKDFEDAVQAACAKRSKASFIVTRNVSDFAKSPVPAITPNQFLKSYNKT